jgi:TATA-box binding protein (TBP) (component of TFIID and TFIIIB)
MASHPTDYKFEVALQAIADYKHGNISCSTPFITTATIVCTLDTKSIDLDAVRTNRILEIRTKKGKKTYRSFSNSVTVLFDKTKAVKVFVNGKLHITGCTKVSQAIGYTVKFCEAMRLHSAVIENVQILTLNTTFKIAPRQNIRLGVMHALLQDLQSEEIATRYNPDIYQGLVVKVMNPSTKRKITMLIFYTGTMIVTGVRCDEELLHAHKVVMDHVAKAADSLLYVANVV